MRRELAKPLSALVLHKHRVIAALLLVLFGTLFLFTVLLLADLDAAHCDCVPGGYYVDLVAPVEEQQLDSCKSVCQNAAAGSAPSLPDGFNVVGVSHGQCPNSFHDRIGWDQNIDVEGKSASFIWQSDLSHQARQLRDVGKQVAQEELACAAGNGCQLARLHQLRVEYNSTADAWNKLATDANEKFRGELLALRSTSLNNREICNLQESVHGFQETQVDHSCWNSAQIFNDLSARLQLAPAAPIPFYDNRDQCLAALSKYVGCCRRKGVGEKVTHHFWSRKVSSSCDSSAAEDDWTVGGEVAAYRRQLETTCTVKDCGGAASGGGSIPLAYERALQAIGDAASAGGSAGGSVAGLDAEATCNQVHIWNQLLCEAAHTAEATDALARFDQALHKCDFSQSHLLGVVQKEQCGGEASQAGGSYCCCIARNDPRPKSPLWHFDEQYKDVDAGDGGDVGAGRVRRAECPVGQVRMFAFGGDDVCSGVGWVGLGWQIYCWVLLLLALLFVCPCWCRERAAIARHKRAALWMLNAIDDSVRSADATLKDPIEKACAAMTLQQSQSHSKKKHHSSSASAPSAGSDEMALRQFLALETNQACLKLLLQVHHRDCLIQVAEIVQQARAHVDTLKRKRMGRNYNAILTSSERRELRSLSTALAGIEVRMARVVYWWKDVQPAVANIAAQRLSQMEGSRRVKWDVLIEGRFSIRAPPPQGNNHFNIPAKKVLEAPLHEALVGALGVGRHSLTLEYVGRGQVDGHTGPAPALWSVNVAFGIGGSCDLNEPQGGGAWQGLACWGGCRCGTV